MPWYKPRGSRTVKGDSRTLPVKGKGLDDGRYSRCWNCGFVCDAQRDRLGDGNSLSGNTAHEFITVNELGHRYDDDPRSAMICIDSPKVHFEAICTPTGPRHDLEPVVGNGCPMCGTPNWRGDY